MDTIKSQDDINKNQKSINIGLKRRNKRATIGFVILSIGIILGLYTQQNNFKNDLKQQQIKLQRDFQVELLDQQQKFQDILAVQQSELQVKFETDLRNRINLLATQGCLSGRENIIKFNDVLDDLIQAALTARQRNLETGNTTRAADNLKSAQRYENDKIQLPSEEECKEPILPPISPQG